MPKLFYRAAYEAACHDAPPKQIKKLTDAHFETTVERLEEALGWLTPEQLCDAFYGDWLLQLHDVGGYAQLQVRSLLIGQGALAANYLAELGQNADDAFDEREGAEVRLLVEGDWLLVANNGRRVTPGNLRGLSRFFIHSGGKVRELNAETIGRFGIGFKSCYRIASEVLVRSWDARDEIIFRLPISKVDEQLSWPEEARLGRVAERLRQVGTPVGAELLTNDKLGYCTPEFLPTLPPSLPAIAAELQRFKRGTLFAFHLHAAGATEVRARISGQEHELYELCPLFLPKVRTVQLGASELKMSESDHDEADGLPKRVEARFVTLTTARSGATSRDRFWRLKGLAKEDHWQIALHADSRKLLNFKNDDDAAFSLREGGAYAFFPLNDANRDFFFRFHLHLDLPTNLSRGDWNAEERENVREQIGRAIDALAEWLETHSVKRHADWQIEGLFRGEPHEGAVWSHEIFTRLKLALRERPLLRTLWGGWRRAPEALAVRLATAGTARRAWRDLCAAAAHVGDRFPFVEVTDQIDLGIPLAGDTELRAFFTEAAQQPEAAPAFWKNMLHSILGAESLTREGVQEALSRVQIGLRDGRIATAAQLFQRNEGAELTEDWHAAFRSAAAWLREQPGRRDLSIFGEPLLTKINRLGTSRFSVEWEELPAKLATLDDWIEHGDRFWASARPFCPAEFRPAAVESMRVKHGVDLWQSLAEVWLVDTSGVRCFRGVIRSWDRGGAVNNEAQTRARARLQNWGLWEEYLSAVEERLEEKLALRLLTPSGENPEPTLTSLCESAHRNSLKGLPTRWQDIVRRAERKAMETFLAARRPPVAGTIYFSTSNADIAFDLRRVLAHLLLGVAEAPAWLNAETWALIDQHGLAQNAGFAYVDTLTAERRTELAQLLLERFWRWKANPPAATDVRAFSALEDLFADARGTWSVGLAANKKAFLNQLFVRASDGPASAAAQEFDCAVSGAVNPKWHVDFLPEPLTRVAKIVAICPGPESLRLEALGEGAGISPGRVHPDILAAPGVADLLASREWRFEFRSPLHLLWKTQGAPVCEIRDAAFVFDGGRFLVSRLTGTLDQDQYRNVLAIYKAHAPEDAAFRLAFNAGQPPQQVYLAFRQQILRVLRDRLVVEEGYEERHVLRELLQNAESAYASRAGGPMDSCPFQARSEPAGSGMCVTVTHRGRAFNEPDNVGQTREDIARIVSLRAEKKNAPDEIGRFNRGFKSVFTVTERVAVRSGPYDFEIEDLLILHPAEPTPVAEPVAETRFIFQCGRADAQKLFGKAGGRASGVFHAASFAFLKFVDEVTLDHVGERRHWTLRRAVPDGGGWGELVVEEPAVGGRERFLVFGGISRRADRAGERRFGAAIRLAHDGTPCELESAWNKLCLTFPTEAPGPFGFLVNGDFDTDGGRVDVRHSGVNESLIKDALDAVAERLRERVLTAMPRAEWLGWARVLAVSEAVKWVTANFPSDHLNIRGLLAACGQDLLRHVPHDGELVVPSRLMRELAGNSYAADWGIVGDDWLDAELEAEVAKIDPEARVRFSLRDFAWSLRGDTARSARVLAALQAPQFLQLFKLNAVDAHELREAVNWLGSLQAAAHPPPLSVQDGFDFNCLEASAVLAWWRENDDPDDYTLDSAVLWPLFGPEGLGENERRAQLVAGLSAPATPAGRRLWYQVLGFACLMSAGWPVERVLRFWTAKLAPVGFWEHTENGFSAADSIFEDAIHEEARGASAAGEDATFWRRIYYDVRKVRHLIYENQFAEAVMELAQDPRDAAHLLQFLKTGKLPGERAHRGVLGQSAGSPLFFVVRELRRLGVIPHPEVDASAFFVCTPVRRLAARLGWIEPKLAASYDFESLGEASHRIHTAAMALAAKDAAVFRKWFDIPLLHYALNNP